jgi:predicted MFS family arabinose efflux permease
MFELTVVAALPLVSEIAPKARATLLSLGVAGFSLGRALGSFIGPTTYDTYGFAVTSIVSAALIFAAFAIWMIWVREKPGEVLAA